MPASSSLSLFSGRISTSWLLLVLWSLSSLPTLLWAFPNAAGDCADGVSSVGGPHATPSAAATLPKGSVTVLLDGQPLTPGVATSFLIGKDHTLTVQRANGYRGILARLGGGDAVGTKALAITTGDKLHAISNICTLFNSVSGITHTTSATKTQSVATLRVNTAVTNAPLDLTIVVSTSESYYSRYILNAVATLPGAAPTAAPVAPTLKPTLKPSLKPVAGSIAPTVNSSATSIKIPKGYCFSDRNTVEVLNKGIVAIKDLRIGDRVKSAANTTNGPVVSDVYSFGHYHPTIKTEYLQIHAQGLARPLEISKDHLIFVNGGRAVPASTVSVGDMLDTEQLQQQPGHDIRAVGKRVTKIKTVTRLGAYAPFTMSGTILVNGVLTSSYVTLQENSSHLVVAGGYKTPLSYQWLEHVFQSPHRLYCRMMVCQSETYSDQGISRWAQVPLSMSLWMLRHQEKGMSVVVAVLIMALLFIPALMLALLVYLFESFFFVHTASWFMVVVPISVVIVGLAIIAPVRQRHQGTRKNKQL